MSNTLNSQIWSDLESWTEGNCYTQIYISFTYIYIERERERARERERERERDFEIIYQI